MTLAGGYRLPVLRQESPKRHPWEGTTSAEHQWTADERTLTGADCLRLDCAGMAFDTVRLRSEAAPVRLAGADRRRAATGGFFSGDLTGCGVCGIMTGSQ